MKKTRYPVLTLDELCRNAGIHAQKMAKTPKLLGHLKEYSKGYYPDFLEMGSDESLQQQFEGNCRQIIYQDVSSFYSLNTTNLDTLKKIIYFLPLRNQAVSTLIVCQ